MIRHVIRHVAWVAALMVSVAMAQAQDSSGAIDFDALFATHADAAQEVMATPGRSRLELTLGSVVVWADAADGGRMYSAMDQSEAGAVGCLWRVYLEVAQISRTCPDLLSAAQADQLEHNMRRVGAFVAANTVPPVAAEAFWRHWDAALAEPAPIFCDAQLDPTSDQLVATMTSDRFEGFLDRMLAVPRLPVDTPCF